MGPYWTCPIDYATQLSLIRGATVISPAHNRSPSVGLERLRLQEVEESRRRRRERPTAVIDCIEVACEAQSPNLDGDQLARRELPLDRRAGDKRHPKPASNGVLDRRVAS